MFEKILVPTDGLPMSDKAVDGAIEFARCHHAQLVALSVAHPYPYTSLLDGNSVLIPNSKAYDIWSQQNASQLADAIVRKAQAADVHCTPIVVVSEDPSQAILDTAAAEHCDAIFMATHGHSNLTQHFLGNEVQKVLTHSMMPVMVFR